MFTPYENERSQMTVLLEKIDDLIEAKFKKYLGMPIEKEVLDELAKSAEFVTLKELCKALNISKPTLNKWINNKRYEWVFKGCIQMKGKRKLYDIGRMKLVLRENKYLFGERWRDYL